MAEIIVTVVSAPTVTVVSTPSFGSGPKNAILKAPAASRADPYRGLLTGAVYGTTKRGVNPVGATVSLFREIDNKLMAVTQSHPTTGAYRFDGLDAHHQYAVVARLSMDAEPGEFANRLTAGA